MAKKGSKARDWDSPENKKKRQDAFRLFVAGRGMKDVMAALDTSSPIIINKFIHSEKWDKHAEIWKANPDKENPYPWDVEKLWKLDLPPAKMHQNYDAEKRMNCIKGFSMYCSGRALTDIAQECGVTVGAVNYWKDTQRWAVCRDRLVDENNPAPWELDGVPSLMSEITASLETMKKSIKFLTGKVLIKAADAAQDLDGMEALGMIRNIKQLAEAAAINFSDGNNPQNAIQINIATKLESMKIPENDVYEAELVVNE